ncbi:MAG: inorganic phosphate transporter [Lewinellaceae bacterium]|nr:inorganic phosphate transporter [Saprospiraceae bacterium]MCB9344328.1 inorganic phosphate transporter [Lewinellaceae bacterium]
MILGFIADLSSSASILFIVCFLAVCFFEAINGFHDTANAVATVIYTKTLPPIFAVVWAGVWNFLGAMLGGIAVAWGILKLMPLLDMMSTPLGENIALVLAILFTAIIWNLGTWYFGIPCSSSHTLIGSLLGGGFAFYTIHSGAGPNWNKATSIGMSLLVSPVFGFALAIALMYLLRVTITKKTIFKSPDHTKKAPPLWIRAILVATCTLVSFFHGNNDGQKGVGLLMVVLIAFMPIQFALSPSFTPEQAKAGIERINTSLGSLDPADTTNQLGIASLTVACEKLSTDLNSYDKNNSKEVYAVRSDLMELNKRIDGAMLAGILKGDVADSIKTEQKHLKGLYEYRLTWAIVLISFCLGLGTMVGWKRIVVTIGEKIGKTHLTYAQGASAELCAAATIGVSSHFGLPVSTTHVLSSAIAGTMVAEGGTKNLQRKTITTIAWAWVLTLPVTFVASALLFYLFRMLA